MNPPIELYTDGSCLNNPGPGGIGYIIKYFETGEENQMPQSKQIEHSEAYRSTTNNRMEILASIKGLTDIIEKVSTGIIKDSNIINMMTDSKYLSDAVNLRWLDKWASNNWMTSGFRGSAPKDVKNKDLWEHIIFIQNKLKNMSITLNIIHIPGHNGHEYNEACDKLAQNAARGTNYLIDEKYEMSSKQR